MRRIKRPKLTKLALLTIVVGLALGWSESRQLFRRVVPRTVAAKVDQWRFGYHVANVTIPGAGGVGLAASVYLPARTSGALPTVYIRHPYDRLRWPEGLQGADRFVRKGFAVVVQDVRGKFGSEGDFIPYQHGTADGVSSLDWIVRQPWSNGRVGTWGCSALGELQYVLARANHPAHRAMIALGAGGAVGSALGRYSYFGLFEGGVFQLASGYGWFLANGQRRPNAPAATDRNPATTLSRLPIAGLVPDSHSATNSYAQFAGAPPADPFWSDLDYVADGDDIRVPALVVNTWGDQTVGETLALAEATRVKSNGEIAQHVVIAPGPHCGHDVWRTGRWGDLAVGNTEQPYDDWYVRWFDYWLRDHGDGLADLPPYLYFQINEDRWLRGESWPPESASRREWYLTSGRGANSARGDGRLGADPIGAREYDDYRYDPSQPVPSRGGPLCCTGNPADRTGPVDQRDVESRDDVLVFTSEPLTGPLRIAGPLRARLRFASTAPDTDIVARLAHVRPDGRSTNIQEGALRVRYRTGFDTPTLLTPNEPVDVTVDMRAIAYTVPEGHRLRLQITSSSFPRLERNLNTGGHNALESIGRPAVNRVLHSNADRSYVEFWALPPE